MIKGDERSWLCIISSFHSWPGLIDWSPKRSPTFSPMNPGSQTKQNQVWVAEEPKSLQDFPCFKISVVWVFLKIKVPQNGWFTMEKPIKIHDLGVPLFLETPIYPLAYLRWSPCSLNAPLSLHSGIFQVGPTKSLTALVPGTEQGCHDPVTPELRY